MKWEAKGAQHWRAEGRTRTYEVWWLGSNADLTSQYQLRMYPAGTNLVGHALGNLPTPGDAMAAGDFHEVLELLVWKAGYERKDWTDGT